MKRKVLKATGNVLILMQKVIKETKSGIIMPAEALAGGSMEQFEGTVVAKGPSVTKFAVGDHVIFGRNVAATHKRYGKEYMIIYEPYVTAVEKTVDEFYELNDSEVVVLEGEE